METKERMSEYKRIQNPADACPVTFGTMAFILQPPPAMRIALPLGVFLLSISALAQDDAKLDLTLSYWPVHSSGTIRAGGTSVDLRSDLGVGQYPPTFSGRLDLRLGRRSRVRVEGTPIRLDGDRTLQRTITYQGRTFNFSDHVTSNAAVDYLYAGYEFDIISRSAGHLGAEVGGAYFGASGTISSQTTGITASRSDTLGMPLAGIAFRVFPLRGPVNVEFNGEVKGMDFGDYGHYFQTTANVGVGRGHVLLEGGYRFMDADVHQTNGLNGVAAEFRGPVISLVLRL